MPKNKPHKGLLKRARITKSGRIKLQRASGRHLRSHKAASAIRSYRLPTFVAPSDMRRMRRLLGLGLTVATRRSASKPTPGPQDA